MNSHFVWILFRDESGVETCGKTEMKWEYRNKNGILRKRKQNFLDESGSGNGNGTVFSDGTDAKIKFLFPIKVEFPFYRCSAWPI
jgi:hypothetical protein